MTLQMWRLLHASHHITFTQISRRSLSGGWQYAQVGGSTLRGQDKICIRTVGIQIDKSDQTEMTLRWVAMQGTKARVTLGSYLCTLKMMYLEDKVTGHRAT